MSLVLFWIAAGLFLGSWLIYPVILLVLSMFRGNPSWTEPSRWPSVSVLLAARNEEAFIGARIENLLDQDYPGKLEILVGSDSSDDATDDIIESYSQRGVILHRSSIRTGKPGIIQALFKRSSGDIVVLTDADTVFAPDTLRQLALPFEISGIGCVDGSRCNSLDGETCESVYWKYEKTVKKLCSSLGAVLGATGAVFALRRESFCPLTARRSDDFELAVMARILGYRCVFNPDAVAVEPSPDDQAQYMRMARITSWMVTSCSMLIGRALKSGRLLLVLQLLVHKMLRWLSGLFLLAVTVIAATLSSQSFYLYVLIAACSFHIAAVLGMVLNRRLPSVFLFPYYFWLMNLASLDGIFRAIIGKPVELWEQGQERI